MSMRSLADLQASVRHAMMGGDPEGLAPVLVGGLAPLGRLALHRRHYEASLMAAVLQKYPATAWLLGLDVFAKLSVEFIRERPPRRPNVAEYAEDFPGYLLTWPGLSRVPYAPTFAELEWHVGRASIAIEQPAMAWNDLAKLTPDELADARIVLQPGIRYMQGRWAVDEVMRAYLSHSIPETFVLAERDTFIEIRGARGAVRLDSVDRATLAFRAALLAGTRLADAAGEALESDAAWNAGTAFRALASAGLIVGVKV